jgi:hypothetical protein
MSESDHSTAGADVSADAGEGGANEQDLPPVQPTGFSRIRRLLSSFAVSVRNTGEVLAPIADSAKHVARSAKGAYSAATSEQAFTLYRQTTKDAVKATAVGAHATVDAARKVGDIADTTAKHVARSAQAAYSAATGDNAMQVYEKVGDIAGEAATQGAKLAVSVASMAGKASAEARLRDKLRKIEALFAGAGTPGELLTAAELGAS